MSLLSQIILALVHYTKKYIDMNQSQTCKFEKAINQYVIRSTLSGSTCQKLELKVKVQNIFSVWQNGLASVEYVPFSMYMLSKIKDKKIFSIAMVTTRTDYLFFPVHIWTKYYQLLPRLFLNWLLKILFLTYGYDYIQF